MTNQLFTQLNSESLRMVQPIVETAPEMSRIEALNENVRKEVLDFLNVRPVHTVVMASFINDNGLESDLNRGKFFGYRNAMGKLEGVALIGHSTLVEARSDEALKALAAQARSSATPIHMIMSHGNAAETFWAHFSNGLSEPRLKCVESLFEVSYPMFVQRSSRELRPATADELLPVAEAQAEIAFMECGVDPMVRDREGFLKRVLRRIEQGRVFVVFEGEKLVFKADIIAETDDVAYLEGIYVAPEYRGKGIGPACLNALAIDLLDRVGNVCMLSNVDFEGAHRSYLKAGFARAGECVTLFV
ncbi:MAG: GNAT family N-acetyltransferase [Pyrinomonadaceae bacterium]